MSHVDPRFRLSNEAGGLGLSCTEDGMTLAGAPLLRKGAGGFEPRPTDELSALLRSAYEAEADVTVLAPALETAARALNSGDLGRAMVAALRLKLPELDFAGAARLAAAEARIAKGGFDPAEARDWLGRWVKGWIGGSPKGAKATSPSSLVTDAQRARAAERLGPGLHKEFDGLGSDDFARRVTKFGQWLEQMHHDGRPLDIAAAQVEYALLQSELAHRIAQPAPNEVTHGHLLSAAIYLAQGANNSEIIEGGHLSPSFIAAAMSAMAYDGPNGLHVRLGPRFAPGIEELAIPPIRDPQSRYGPPLEQADVQIHWEGGIKDKGEPWEAHNDNLMPPGPKQHDNAKTFDQHNSETGNAISDKVLDTRSPYYRNDARRLYSTLKKYIDQIADYKPRDKSSIDLGLEQIKSRTLRVAVHEYTTPDQWIQVLRAIVYGRQRGVVVEFTRIRETKPWGYWVENSDKLTRGSFQGQAFQTI